MEFLPDGFSGLYQGTGLKRLLVTAQVVRVCGLTEPPQQCAIQTAFNTSQAPATLRQSCQRDSFQGVAIGAEDILSEPQAQVFFPLLRSSGLPRPGCRL